jgi:hypothetical protein
LIQGVGGYDLMGGSRSDESAAQSLEETGQEADHANGQPAVIFNL